MSNKNVSKSVAKIGKNIRLGKIDATIFKNPKKDTPDNDDVRHIGTLSTGSFRSLKPCARCKTKMMVPLDFHHIGLCGTCIDWLDGHFREILRAYGIEDSGVINSFLQDVHDKDFHFDDETIFDDISA
jgi:hypothetical protein